MQKTPVTAVYNATVSGREEINPHLIILRVKPEGEVFQFVPGQFAVLGLLGCESRIFPSGADDLTADPNKLIRRAYSIASSCVERQHLEFYLTLVTSGELTPRLFALRQGGRLFLSTRASGAFTMDRVSPRKSVILVSTGTGLAPYMSMLRTMLAHDIHRKFVVLHGARHSWDLGYREELENLTRLRPNLTYIPSITRPKDDPHFQGQTGRIQTLLEGGVVEELAGLPLHPEVADVFLCGNPTMIDETKELLQRRGFESDHGKHLGTIHSEEYW